MKIGRRALFGFGAAAAVAAPVVALAAKPVVAVAEKADAIEAIDTALDADLAEFARQYRAEFIAAFEARESPLRKTVTTDCTYSGGVTWSIADDWKE